MDESGGTTTANTKDLDKWIEQLYECKQLSEPQVKGIVFEIKMNTINDYIHTLKLRPGGSNSRSDPGV